MPAISNIKLGRLSHSHASGEVLLHAVPCKGMLRAANDPDIVLCLDTVFVVKIQLDRDSFPDVESALEDLKEDL